MSNNYVITKELFTLLIVVDYRVGVRVQKGQNFDCMIIEWFLDFFYIFRATKTT